LACLRCFWCKHEPADGQDTMTSGNDALYRGRSVRLHLTACPVPKL